MDRAARICIIGAGAAGLTAAHLLGKRGYGRVTVLEKDQRIGGKCWTIERDGRTYELGAGIHTVAYRTVSEIMKDVGVRTVPVRSSMQVDLDRGTFERTPLYFRPANLLSFGAASVLAAAALAKNRRIFHPGFAGIAPELCQPFASWARERHLGPVADVMTSIHTGFGYGYYAEVAAAYVLKYMTIFCPPREYLDGGYQGLWQRVASGLDVRLGTQVRSIERGDTVLVNTDDDALGFDYLILACPLDEALAFLDAGDEEKDLFAKIRYYDYHVYAGLTEGLPEVRYAFIPKSEPQRTVFWYRRWLDTGLCTFYGLGRSSLGMREPADHERIRANIEEDIAKIGGRITGYETDTVWKYFPHVSPGDMAAGYYQRLEALQGQRRTFYTGELLNFSTVETVSRYSKRIVDDFF